MCGERMCQLILERLQVIGLLIRQAVLQIATLESGHALILQEVNQVDKRAILSSETQVMHVQAWYLRQLQVAI